MSEKNFSGRVPVEVEMCIQAGRGKVVVSSGELETYFYISLAEVRLLKFYKEAEIFTSLDPFEKDTAGYAGVLLFFAKKIENIDGDKFVQVRLTNDKTFAGRAYLIYDSGFSLSMSIYAGLLLAFSLNLEIVADKEIFQNQENKKEGGEGGSFSLGLE